MRLAVLAALAASLAGCSASPVTGAPDTVPAPLASPTAPAPTAAPSAAAARRPCPPLDPAIASEALRLTPIASSSAGGTDGLTAGLMASELRKNARLRQIIAAYQRCHGP